MNLESICSESRLIVARAAAFIKSQAGRLTESAIEYKGFNDLVSYVDRQAEEILVNGLRTLLPDSGFITEEQTATASGERLRWVIDPLDGTTNFVHGLPWYCVSVALLDGDRTVLGIVHEINLDECFYSWEGAPAFLNGNAIRVSRRQRLADSLVATGFPYTDFSQLDAYMQVFDSLMKNTHGIRRPGSAAADLAYVACGRFDAFYEYGLNAWDVAAGAFLVKQAGGCVSDFSGGDGYLFGKEIIATNHGVFEAFSTLVRTHMKP